MTQRGVPIGVQRMVRLHRVSVLILTAAPAAPSLADSLSEVVADELPLVVIDCLDIDALDVAGRQEIVNAHRALQRAARHMVVVNVRQPDAAVLREHGLDVGATVDVVYTDDPIDPIDPLPTARRIPAARSGRRG
jgi:anti-anti-sigma regulatory factor